MPGGDRTGPMGQGRGLGRGSSSGFSGGSEEFCVCPSCGEKISHQRGFPCNNMNCPKCGTNMVRQ